jgi:hypothetical protein
VFLDFGVSGEKASFADFIFFTTVSQFVVIFSVRFLIKFIYSTQGNFDKCCYGV